MENPIVSINRRETSNNRIAPIAQSENGVCNSFARLDLHKAIAIPQQTNQCGDRTPNP
jgi:hypothetical protein